MTKEPAQNLHPCYYAVAFVDLLGQQEAMRDLDHIPQTKEEETKFITAMKETAGVVADLNESLSGFLKAAEPTGGHSGPLAELLREVTDCEVKYQRFSDGLVIFASLADSGRACPVVGVGTLLLACASLMLMSLAKRRPIRGGIDVGVGMELFPDELYGPALAKTYLLESTVAQYPRIVVGDTLFDYLVKGARRQGKEERDAVWREVARNALGFLDEDTDGHLILDYLGEGVRAVYGDTVDEELLSRVTTFVEEQGKEHREAKNTKLVMRYSMLTDYLLPRLSHWRVQGEQESGHACESN